ncbi:SusC/RagA family TonB-linked outer membrane protein [Sphingobacterium yanglingense]|uniref:TonB-linked SusC/RagA family outer membrane protein n=1 Tax=Sphingobacterium yanglingense TaxID=1437280 RepID=A0A4R6WIC3_9SPHI|nr:TonB-dependent receptor [Sphingobacterium yanglingense]TDQ78296.1 TonB-linked SusC/RagA family outer membrane protein [Sphingobacterium yanglingense]
MRSKVIYPMLIYGLFSLFQEAHSQNNIRATGKVMSTEGEAISSVTIEVQNVATKKKEIFHSNEEGVFNLSNLAVNGVYNIYTHHIGFQVDSIVNFTPKINQTNSILIRLRPDNTSLDEVVVIGYGTIQKKDLTGAISTLDGKDIASRKTTQLSQALQGAIPGVMATRNNSAPGAAATIRVRGITTITDGGLNPLIILDGVPISGLDQVNPNDVENVTVLKDAASASIYGSRAAAGVILITSKRGKEGVLSLDYNTDLGFETPTQLPEYVGAQRYLQLVNELRWNDNNNNQNEYPIYAKDLVENYNNLNLENPNLYPITDWQSILLKKRASRQSHQLSVAGSGKNLRTRFSLGYDDTDALYVHRNYERLTSRLNNNIDVTDYLSAVVDLSFKRTTDNRPSIDPMYRMGITAPIYAGMWDDGRVAAGKDGDNIYGMLTEGGQTKYQYTQFGGKVGLDLKPLDGLTLTGVIAPMFNFDRTKAFRKKVPYTAWNNPEQRLGYINGYETTKLTESRVESYQYTTQFLANYTKGFGKHNLNLLGGYEFFYYYNEDLSASRDQYLLSSYPYLDLGPLEFRDNSGSAYENAYRSYFGRAMYNFANKYFIQANIRYDGSSRFAKEYRWGMFPSVSAGWSISEENFMKDISWLDFLKVRASYGTLGNERIGNYPYQSLIEFSNGALFYNGNTAVSAQSASQWQYAIRDITWEKTESYDLGLDFTGLSNRFNATFDVYKKITSDMLLALQIPSFIGFNNPNQNTGKMNTKGWELALGWKDKVNKLKYAVSFNISNFKSVMGDLGGTEFLGDQVKKEGSEFNEWYGYLSDGLFQNTDEVTNSPVLNANVKPGDIKYKDISGPDGVPDGKISPEYDRVFLGGSLPQYLYGGQISLGYGGLALNVVVQGVGKQKTRQTIDMIQPYQQNWGNFLSILDGNTWSRYNSDEENENAKYPRYSNTSASNNYAMSDFWMINGKYFRLKSVNLSYQIPEVFLAKYAIKGLGLSFTANDILTVNKFPKGWDPEMTSFTYPITASYLFGINVKF